MKMLKLNTLIILSSLFGGALHAEVAILPSEVTLSGPASTQRLLVVKMIDQTASGTVEEASYVSSDPKVAIVKEGVVIPKADGTATITVTSGKETATTAVVVKGVAAPHQWDFRNHVLPVISKAGCNMGACHGALAGKGGFRLSLRGYDPVADFHTIVKEARGRRIEMADPGRSLLLTKGTTALKHTGGQRIKPGSADYDIVADWIANGAPAPKEDDARLAGLEIFPDLSVLKPGDDQRLLVRATYSDGRQEDVTHWARFTSADETVATVDEDGTVSVIGHGEGAVTAWFSSQIVIARITAPYPNKLDPKTFSEAPVKNFIDELTLAQLERLNLPPSLRSDDATFIRRAFVDTIGVLPTPEEVRAFIADESMDKREQLIEELLIRPEFVDYWTYRWADVFLVTGSMLRPDAVKAYYHWLRKNVADNVSWDEIARQLVTAKGGSLENGATNFYAVHQDPETMAENVSQAFMSLSIGCAKCHNHPLEKWTNDQYYAFANLFSRVRGKGWGGDARNGDGVRTIYVESRGDLIQPGRGMAQPPAPLDAEPIPQDDTGDRREVLAAWLTNPDNPYFTRSVTNRVWANFFGIGLVDPVDDLRASNPASNEPLLAALSEHVIENRFNLKALMRVILNSETYQRSSKPLPENQAETRFFSHYYPRRHMAEVLHDAIADITDVPTVFNEVALNDGSKTKTDFYEKGTRAMQLYDSAVDSYFLKTFGRNARDISCECERSNQPSMVQVLHLSNGNTINDKIAAKTGNVERLLKSGKPNAEIVEDVYLLCLSRKPSDDELSAFEEIFDATPDAERRDTLEDLFWSLMTSREFLFQH